MDQLVAAALFVLALSASVFSGCLAADADPLQDVCVADLNSTLSLNGFSCKPIEELTVNDFVSRSLRSAQPTTTPNAFIPTPLFVQQFPGLNTAGIGLLRVDLGPEGVNAPHTHPRANELVLIDAGKVLVGFIDGQNKLFMKVLEKGDAFIIPRGAVHFQFNVGKTPASFFAIFNSQQPGLFRLPSTLFGSGIPDIVLQKSFQLSKETIAELQKTHSARG